jgi:endonuclease/exonuclease/phosphatase family metal-dependent hydrolase
MIKVLTLNIWRYEGNWPERKKKIISTINKEKPDFVFLQEVFDDQRHQTPDDSNQLKQLNKEIKFKHAFFDVAEQLTTEYGKSIKEFVLDGLGCLTNLPSENSTIRLKKEEKDKHYRTIQVVKTNIHGKEYVFYHTHYSNTNEWSKLHLIETLEHAKRRNENPIIVGDLNILYPEVIEEVCSKDYKCSYQVKKYVSFPSKNEVLDYVVIPQNMSFESVECLGDGLSDHKALVVQINL